MRAVVQRVSSARVEVDKEIVGEISNGLLVLLGVEKGDVESDLNYLVDKVSGLRVFEDDAGKMNLSVASAAETGARVLVVSQFTLLGDVRKGKRPAFTAAEDPGIAKTTYMEFVDRLKALGLSVETGVFAADMQVHLVNDGPVTILLDSRKKF